MEVAGVQLAALSDLQWTLPRDFAVRHPSLSFSLWFISAFVSCDCLVSFLG
jgi:hypothetical protein